MRPRFCRPELRDHLQHTRLRVMPTTSRPLPLRELPADRHPVHRREGTEGAVAPAQLALAVPGEDVAHPGAPHPHQEVVAAVTGEVVATGDQCRTRPARATARREPRAGLPQAPDQVTAARPRAPRRSGAPVTVEVATGGGEAGSPSASASTTAGRRPGPSLPGKSTSRLPSAVPTDQVVVAVAVEVADADERVDVGQGGRSVAAGSSRSLLRLSRRRARWLRPARSRTTTSPIPSPVMSPGSGHQVLASPLPTGRGGRCGTGSARRCG